MDAAKFFKFEEIIDPNLFKPKSRLDIKTVWIFLEQICKILLKYLDGRRIQATLSLYLGNNITIQQKDLLLANKKITLYKIVDVQF